MGHGTADNINPANLKQSCDLCKFSARNHGYTNNKQIELILCKRYPPVIVHGEMGMQVEYSAWPTLPSDAWCGEFARKSE